MADDTEQKKPELIDLTWFGNRSLGGVEPSEVNSARGRDFLAALRKYDPNADFLPETSNGQVRGYTLYYDPAKLPGAQGSGVLGPTNVDAGQYMGGGAFIPSWSTVQSQMKLINPDLVIDSPVYGRITPNSNIDARYSPGFAALGLLGTGAFAFGAPFLASAMSGGAIGGASPGMYALGGSGAAGGGGVSGEMLPLMPNANPYEPMLPFNPGDPGYGMLAPGGAGAVGGGGMSGELLPLIPNENPYNPMLPFNPADPSYALPQSWWSRLLSGAGDLMKTPGLSGLLGGAPSGGAGGLLGGAGGGRGGGSYGDLLAVLSAYYGVPQETAKHIARDLAAQGAPHA